MGILSSIFGGSVAEPIKAIGNVVDKCFTSDDERLTHAEIKLRLEQKPQLAQVELNKLEAQNRNLFVAGWRPFIGWICGAGLCYEFLIRPLAVGFGLINFPHLDITALHSLIIAMLGLGGLRTVEKFGNKTK